MSVHESIGRSDRKDNHIQICLKDEVDQSQALVSSFDCYTFDHDCLPETSKDNVCLKTTLFGKNLSAPIIIGAMTGGTEKAAMINRRLAEAASETQVGFALGSQRKMIEDSSTCQNFISKQVYSKLPLLFGNLGAVQFNYGVTNEDVKRLIDLTACDVFTFHLNPLQEAIQPEGNTDFKDLVKKLKQAVMELKIPVTLKEVGAGISKTAAKKIAEINPSGVEVAGVGGTSWAKVETLRNEDPVQKLAGSQFTSWGIPTAESLVLCKQELPSTTLIASGGIRNGIDVAKAIALGADAAAMALPFLKAASESTEAVVRLIATIMEELRIVCFVTGSKDIAALRKARLTKKPNS